MQTFQEIVLAQFPQVHAARGNGSIYLDTAATSQTATCALAAMQKWQASLHSNVHRGFYTAAEQSTDAYEAARVAVQQYLHAANNTEIIFTKNCTEALNICVKSWGAANLTASDTVALCRSSHHSAVVPWLQLQQKIGFAITWIALNDDGWCSTTELETLCTTTTVKAVCVPSVSNALGSTTDIANITSIAHNNGAICIVDAAQHIAHAPIDVQQVDCDFIVFSGHKMYGPTGIGVLYGKQAVLEQMEPMLGGGMMIDTVTEDRFVPTALPHKFEAGTPPIAAAIGLGAVCTWLQTLDWPTVQMHERNLLQFASESLALIPGIKVLYPHIEHTGCSSFYCPKLHAHDIADILGRSNIATRAGQHCCQPLHLHLGLLATVRISVGMYTTKEDIDTLVKELKSICANI